jgi:hypothetical protein
VSPHVVKLTQKLKGLMLRLLRNALLQQLRTGEVELNLPRCTIELGGNRTINEATKFNTRAAL